MRVKEMGASERLPCNGADRGCVASWGQAFCYQIEKKKDSESGDKDRNYYLAVNKGVLRRALAF